MVKFDAIGHDRGHNCPGDTGIKLQIFLGDLYGFPSISLKISADLTYR